MRISELVQELSRVAAEQPIDRLDEQIRSAGTEAVPALIELLETHDEPDSGWGPAHAARLLGELGDERAVEPMLKALAETSWDDPVHDQLVRSLPHIGAAVVEPALGAVLKYRDSELTASLATILADAGVHDPRILALLLDELRRYPEKGSTDLGMYGDPAAVPYISAAIDAEPIGADTTNPLAHDSLIEMSRALEELGGALTPEQQRKVRHAHELASKARTLALGVPRRKTAVPSRNEPCYCGSGKKYKKCCLRADEAAGGSE